MSLSRPFAVSIGLAAGLVAAVGFYTAAVGVDAPQKVTARPQPVPAVAVVTPEPVVSLAPCEKPAKLEDGACVTHKVVTKVIPAPAPAPAAARPAARPARPAAPVAASPPGPRRPGVPVAAVAPVGSLRPDARKLPPRTPPRSSTRTPTTTTPP